MSAPTVLRLDVPSPDLLDRAAGDALPFGLRSGAAERSFLRDVHLDTPDGELQQRGVSCRFRIASDDRRYLTVTVRETQGAGSLVEWQRFESEVSEVEPTEAMLGTSEPARRLRAVLDPRRLAVRVELEIERRTRIARSSGLPLRTLELSYDAITVRTGSLIRRYQEIVVRRLRRGGIGLEDIAEALRDRYGVRPVIESRVERAEELLSVMESDVPRGASTTVPWQVLLPVRQGHVGVRVHRGALTFVGEEGKGEAGCRRLAAGICDPSHCEFQLLNTAAATPASPAIEVWLAHLSAEGERLRPADMAWVPFHAAASLAGSPVLCDSMTLAALSVLVRSEIWDAQSGTDGSAGATVEPRLDRWRPPDGVEGTDFPPRYLNRDISWLEFNQRLLELAEDEREPLLARVRFLAIFSSNIDEFFMVRVGALKRALAEGKAASASGGMSVHDQLEAIAVRLRYLLQRQRRCLETFCLPELERRGVRVLRWDALSGEQRSHLERHFNEQVLPLLTPRAITRAPGHPFPHISGLSLSLAVTVRDRDSGRLRFGSITIPEVLPGLVHLPGGFEFVPIEDVVRAHLARLYPGRTVEAAHVFRVTRSGDLELDEEHADDLLEAVEEEVKRRPFAFVVRLEIERSMPRVLRELLQRELRVESPGRGGTPGASGVFEVDGLLDVGRFAALAELGVPDLDYPPFLGKPVVPPDRSIFDVLRDGDVLVHHPYDAFEDSVQRLFETAAVDPAVEAIKLTLYRAGRRSPVVEALIRAAQAGKDVAVFVELKARFDEERNVDWVRRLEAAGAHVVYGLVHLKTHAKTALVARREEGAVRTYVHIGTGNYNASTARLYTDLGLLSYDPDLGADLRDFFNGLTGSSGAPQTEFRSILVAPTNMLARFRGLVRREIEHATAGRAAGIRAKLNGVADNEMIELLYEASNAGVSVDLIVRGICTLRPGAAGMSERIRVVTHLGRFLEHARIYHFTNGGQEEYYLGSADWRPRNLRRRVEVVAPVRDAEACARLDRILNTELADPSAWELRADGTHVRRAGPSTPDPRSAQEEFIRQSGRQRGIDG